MTREKDGTAKGGGGEESVKDDGEDQARGHRERKKPVRDNDSGEFGGHVFASG